MENSEVKMGYLNLIVVILTFDGVSLELRGSFSVTDETPNEDDLGASSVNILGLLVYI